MPGTVKLEVVQGPMKGKTFAFDEHDAFLFGRRADCHARLPDDPSVSRHHFILEVNPPDARVRDLGSMSGTWVNGTKHGGRGKGESPQDAAGRRYPEVDLKDGDSIKVGATVLAVRIAAPAAAGPVLCQKCRRDVAAEAGRARQGDYICLACRNRAKADPGGTVPKGETKKGGESPFGGYVLLRRLATGGFGAVHLAQRPGDPKPVAIKEMLSQVAVDPENRRRFMREIEITKALRHKNVISLIDHHAEGGAFYFVMEYCAGGSALDLMKRCGGRIPLDQAGPIMLQALEGLEYLHSRDFVHRDLKPGNILLAAEPGPSRVKISDLGLAKNFLKSGFSGLTLSNSVGGTEAFMPREQVVDFRRVRPVSDIWSMGAAFYSMLSGRVPRDFPEGVDQMLVILRDDAVPLSRRDPSIPPRVAAVIDRAVLDDTAARWPAAARMREALEKALY